jgi:putative transposase
VAGFIAAQRAQHDIPHVTACRALAVSPAWFYKWRHGDPSPRHARREQLAVEVRRLFAKQRGTYGSPRITADLRDEGWRVSENTVAAIMRELGLAARRRRRRKQTTRQGRGQWRAPDLIGRDFGTDRLNHKWYGDGTEIATDESKLYLDSVLDMGSRRIVGFALGEHHDTDLAQAALQMAVAVRGGKDASSGVIMHTDQGSEYTAKNFQAACGRVGIKQSMGRAGSALDNAVIESWHSTVEFELRELEHFATKAQARVRVAAWIEEYNHHRRHSSLGMLSPVAYELELAQQRGRGLTEPSPRAEGRSMSTPLPPAQHGAVLAGVKATPSGWPPASLDPGCGRRTPAATGSPAQGEIRQIQVSTVSGDCRGSRIVAGLDGRLATDCRRRLKTDPGASAEN